MADGIGKVLSYPALLRPQTPVVKPTGMPNTYDAVINKHASALGVEPQLVKAVIQTESQFDKNARSGVGAAGLMQIMPSNFKHLGVRDPYNIEQNIRAGTQLLSNYIKRFGTPELALAAYNGGEGRLASRGRDINRMPPETRAYVPKVMSYYKGGI